MWGVSPSPKSSNPARGKRTAAACVPTSGPHVTGFFGFFMYVVDDKTLGTLVVTKKADPAPLFLSRFSERGEGPDVLLDTGLVGFQVTRHKARLSVVAM